MNEFEVSIVDYLGKIDSGVLVLLSLGYQGYFFEATFFYTREEMVLTISDELESVIGDIREHPEYMNLLSKILKRVVPINEIWDRIDYVDIEKFIRGQIELFGEDDAIIVDESEIKKLE